MVLIRYSIFYLQNLTLHHTLAVLNQQQAAWRLKWENHLSLMALFQNTRYVMRKQHTCTRTYAQTHKHTCILSINYIMYIYIA